MAKSKKNGHKKTLNVPFTETMMKGLPKGSGKVQWIKNFIPPPKEKKEEEKIDQKVSNLKD